MIKSRFQVNVEDEGVCDMVIAWWEVDPMVVLFDVIDKGCPHLTPYAEWWRAGRSLFHVAAFRNRHAGLGDIRIGPLTAKTTRMQLTNGEQCVFVDMPTEELRKFLIRTYNKVNPEQEDKALQTYLDNWLSRTLKPSAPPG